MFRYARAIRLCSATLLAKFVCIAAISPPPAYMATLKPTEPAFRDAQALLHRLMVIIAQVSALTSVQARSMVTLQTSTGDV